MTVFAPLLLLAAFGAADVEPAWSLAVDGDVKVYVRERPGGRVKEVKAEAVFDCTPKEFMAVLMSHDPKKKTPYVAENRLVSQVDATTHIQYTRLSFPIVDDRDYFIEVHLESDLAADGTGVFRSTWKPWGLDKPTRDGVVRVNVNEGYWQVESANDAHTQTHSTYYLYSDPGGNLPAWIINMGNKRVMPDVLHKLYEQVVANRAKPAPAPVTPPTMQAAPQ
jgi:hypothetical protein